MQEGREFKPLGFGDRTVQARHFTLIHIFEFNNSQNIQKTLLTVSYGNPMTTKSDLSRVVDRERRTTWNRFQLFIRFFQIFLPNVVNVKRISFLKNRVQNLADTVSRNTRIGKLRHQFGQLRHAAHADFIPTRHGTDEGVKSRIGRFVSRILQAGRVDKMLQNRPFRRNDRGVFLFQFRIKTFQNIRTTG